ncbi:hypothetical protein MRX96_006069 [Rhipicephalus microplus]
MQPAVSILVRRVARVVVNARTSYKWVHFPRTAEEKAAVKEEFLRFGRLPGVIGCVDGSFVTSRMKRSSFGLGLPKFATQTRQSSPGTRGDRDWTTTARSTSVRESDWRQHLQYLRRIPRGLHRLQQ